MLRLNLLPPQDKKRIELANLNSLVVFLSFCFLSILVISALVLSSISFYLSDLLRDQDELIAERQNDLRIQQSVEIEEKIKQANQRVNQIYLKQKDLVLWTSLLEELAKITPTGVYLTGFSYQLTNSQINLSGWADQRDELLLFQNSLESNPHFAEIEAPLSNLFKQNDIDFSFTLRLK